MVGVSSLVHLLVSHWPVYWSRGQGSYRWSVCSLVTRPSVRVMSLVGLLELWSLVRLLGSWSLVCLFGSWSLACSSVAGLLFVRRWPWWSICHWYIARASARLVVGVSLVCRWCVVGVSVCVPLVRRCPIPVHGHWSVAHPSAHLSGRASGRIRFACRWSVTRL